MRANFLLLAAALSLGACSASDRPLTETAQPVASSSATSAPDIADLEGKAIEDALDARLVSSLTKACGAGYTSSVMDICVRDALLSGFDDNGRASENCAYSLTGSDLLECIVVGAIMQDIAARLGGDPDEVDWSSLRQFAGDAIKSYARTLGSLCDLAHRTAVRCVTENFGGRLSLPDGDTAACQGGDDPKAALGCQFRKYMVRFFEGGFDRIDTLHRVSA